MGGGGGERGGRGGLGYPESAAAELLDGTLQLRYCTSIFTMKFLLPVVYQG